MVTSEERNARVLTSEGEEEQPNSAAGSGVRVGVRARVPVRHPRRCRQCGGRLGPYTFDLCGACDLRYRQRVDICGRCTEWMGWDGTNMEADAETALHLLTKDGITALYDEQDRPNWDACTIVCDQEGEPVMIDEGHLERAMTTDDFDWLLEAECTWCRQVTSHDD